MQSRSFLVGILVVVVAFPKLAFGTDTPASQASRAYILGCKLLEHEAFDDAIKEFDEAIRLDPKNVLAHAKRGETEFRRGNLDRALKDLDEAIKLNPKSVPSLMIRSQLWAHKGNLDLAIKDYTSVIQVDPKHAEAYSRRSHLRARKEGRDLDGAFEDARQAISLEPHIATWWFNLGVLLYATRDWEGTIEAFDHVIKLDPKNVSAYQHRGDAHVATRKFEMALNDYREALRLDPKHSRTRYNYGVLLAVTGQLEKAVCELTEAIKLNSQDPLAFARRGEVYYQLREWNKALVDFKEALRLDPTSAGAFAALATFRASCPDSKFRDGKQALADAKRACELSDWRNPRYFETLAAAYAETGQFDQAVKWQKMALEDQEYVQCRGGAVQTSLKLYEGKKPLRMEPKR